MSLLEINKRYTTLAEDTCCLSCGGAINFSKPLKGEICVDLGSGRGTDVIRMAEQVGDNGFVYGVDISDGMIRKAIKSAEKVGATNVKFLQSDLEKLDIETGTVDLLISNCTINHALDKQQVWNEVFRILKDDGRFVTSDIYSLEEVPEKYRKDEVAISECWAGADTKEKYMKTLENAGFKNIEILEESTPYEKGEIKVASFTIKGKKKAKYCC